MRAVIPLHGTSRAVTRLGNALAQRAPCEVVRIPQLRRDVKRHHLMPGEDKGDLIVLFVTGYRDHYQALVERARHRGQRYAVVQIALRTTKYKSTNDWRRFWRGARTVWSYYPLREWIHEDGGSAIDFDFYDAPLGVDPAFWAKGNGTRQITVYASEAPRECMRAAQAVDGHAFVAEGVTDEQLAAYYADSCFVSGMRRHEGFELPAAEGLLCGARPVLFDQLHYRRWYDAWGEFVPEGTPDDVVASLTDVFRRGARPVTADERTHASMLFDWERLCAGFWERALA